MAISSYTELVSELGDWLNRADLSAKIPTFIRLFEARMNRRLRSPDMEQSFSFTTVSGTTVYPLSARVRELREVFVADDGSLDRRLSYKIVGEAFEFSSDPGDGIDITYSAYATLPALGAATSSNWLLDDHPDIYLFGSLARAEAYLKDDNRVAVWKSAEDEALSEITREANSKRMPAGPLVSRPFISDGNSLTRALPSGSSEDDPGDLVGLL